jgi:hypothetical protein
MSWRWVGLCALGAVFGCTLDGMGRDKTRHHDEGGAGGSGGEAGAATTAVSSGSGGAATSGGGGTIEPLVPEPEWHAWPAQQARSSSSWGTALTDIANHLPAQYGTYYDDPDLVTFGHETTHGIHAHLRNYENDTGQTANAFYVLDDRAALVVEPGILKSDVAAYVPPSLRDFRYETYVTGAPDWNDTPLYLWDEWVAYTNGAEVGVNRVGEGLWSEGWRDQSGNLEFVVYALAVGMAVSELDPAYFGSYPQFTRFLAWNVTRGMKLFHDAEAMPEFQADNVATYYETMRTSPDAEALRQFARTTFGDTWATDVLGI